MANYQPSNKKKRGRQPTKLSVKLFLLGPEKEITKVTKETCSKENIIKLMQEGYGPPQPEHCVNDDKEKVEFLFEQTNEQFKQKLVEIYPTLENTCFVFLKADKNNILEELSPGRCCYRCYTPENVYHSERGQGRLYVRKIAENQISQCTHGVPLIKRLCASNNQQRYIPILPKQLPSGSTITGVETESRGSVVTSVAMTTSGQLAVSRTPGLSGIPFCITSGATPVLDLSSSSMHIELVPPVNISSDVTRQVESQTSAIVSAPESAPPFPSFVSMLTGHLQPSTSTFSMRSGSMPQIHSSINVATQNHLPISKPGISQTVSTPSLSSAVVTTTTLQPSTSTLSMSSESIPLANGSINVTTPVRLPMFSSGISQSMLPFYSPVNMLTQGHHLQTTSVVSGSLVTPSQFLTSSRVTHSNLVGSPFITPVQATLFNSTANSAVQQDLEPLRAHVQTPPSMVTPNADIGGNLNINMRMQQQQTDRAGLQMIDEFGRLRDTIVSASNMVPPQQPSVSMAFNDLTTLADIITHFSDNDVQGNLNLPATKDQLVTAFLENVERTQKLEISLDVLNNSDLLKKLKETTSSILTMEIQSTCKLHQVVKDYSLPSSLKVLRITDNYLSCQDAFALGSSLSRVKGLDELDLSRTKFEEGSFYTSVSILKECSNLKKLYLADNSLPEEELACFTAAFKSIKNLTHLNLSKSKLTEKQANKILKNFRESESIDLSRNGLEGTEIIARICQMQSLREIILSHNHIKFFPLPKLQQQHENLPVNMQIISLSSNHMMPEDIAFFCSLIRSDLLKLNVASNHVGNSIWALCSPRIKHLKALNLANTDVSSPAAVQGLAFLLSIAKELEELDLSSNNLILSGEDFSKILSSLGCLKGLKHLEFRDNVIGPEGAKALAGILKEFPLLERLDLSSSYMKEDDIRILCTGLTPLKNLKYLNLSGNRMAVEVLNDPLLLPSSLEEVIFSDVIHGEKLFDAMRHLRYLRKLHFSKMKLIPRDIEALSTMLSSFPLLEDLTLSNIDIVDFKCERMFRVIKSLLNIRKIDLSGMILPDGEALADMLSSCSVLEELVLDGMVVTNRECEIIFCAIKLLTKMKKLDFRGMLVKKNDIKAFSEMLSFLSFLEEIVFPTFTGKCYEDGNDGGLKRPLCSLKSAKYLKVLHVGDSCKNFTDFCAKTFSEVIPCLQLLEKLVISYVVCREQHLLPALETLKYVKVIHLKFRPGAAALTKVLSSLQSLEKLVLGTVDFDNEGANQFFCAVGSLRYLKELKLLGTRYTGNGTEALADMLPRLIVLEKLTLIEIEFLNQQSLQRLLAALGSLRYLRELDVIFCMGIESNTEASPYKLPSLRLLEKLVLSDYDASELLFEIPLYTFLKYLELYNVRINSVSLANVFSQQFLEELMIVGEVYNDNESENLFDAIGKLRNLKKLELPPTMITKTNVKSLAKALSSLQLLEELVFNHLNLHNEIGKLLFDAIRKLKYLKKLILEWSSIDQNGAEALVEALPSLKSLEVLALGEIDFDVGKEQQLFNAVRKLVHLKKLCIRGTLTTQNSVTALAEVLPSLHYLKRLTLSDINFRNKSDQQLFTRMEKLKRLKRLDLNCCEITQSGAKTLTDVVRNLPGLTFIGLPARIQHDSDRTGLEKLKEEFFDLGIDVR